MNTQPELATQQIIEGREHLRREVVLATRQWFRTGDVHQLRVSVEALELYEKEHLERLG